jgi:prepilin signal peptidase PulO-like enzyme (type II secretory pathway)
MKKLNFVVIFLLIIFFILTIQNSFGQILRFQAFIDLSIITLTFWVLILLTAIRMLFADIGFLKLGAGLAVLLAIFMFIFFIIIKPSQYKLVRSENYEIIVEIDNSTENRIMNIYKKKNFLFSEKIFTLNAPENYEYQYEIIGSNLVISRCTETICIEEPIPLE